MKKNSKPISMNHTFVNFRSEMNAGKIIIDITKSLGISKEQESVINKIETLNNELKNIPLYHDAFNAYFSKRGWITYESFHVPTLIKTVDLMKKDDLESAEKVLLDYYKETKHFRGQIMSGGCKVKAFIPRKHLALEAMTDYENGKYNSCILLLLTIIDGLVNDISNLCGFFSKSIDVTSWDGIAGHHTGLKQIQKIYYKKRNKTNKEEITMPYRNGILHGRDLKYNNIYVAAKLWGCLMAVLDWRRDIANGKGKY